MWFPTLWAEGCAYFLSSKHNNCKHKYVFNVNALIMSALKSMLEVYLIWSKCDRCVLRYGENCITRTMWPRCAGLRNCWWMWDLPWTTLGLGIRLCPVSSNLNLTSTPCQSICQHCHNTLRYFMGWLYVPHKLSQQACLCSFEKIWHATGNLRKLQKTSYVRIWEAGTDTLWLCTSNMN